MSYYRVAVDIGGERPLALSYLPKEGLLGRPGEWYTVPAAFKAWMDTKVKGATTSDATSPAGKPGPTAPGAKKG